VGYGDLVGEAVEAATADMGNVQAAVDAIEAAARKAQGLLDPATWFGAPATAWIGQWQGVNQPLLSCLAGLPEAEQSIIAAVRSQMMAQVEAMTKAADQHASQPSTS
jgi:hypothetical protein